MRRRGSTLTGIVGLVLAQGLAGCAPGSFPAPAAPTPKLHPPPLPVPQPPAVMFALFTDPASGFSTSDVRDVQEQIVRVNTADELIWMDDGKHFPEFIADGNYIAYHHKADKFFQVRFGIKEGEPRAYLTWTDDGLRGAIPTILDLWVDERGDLKIAETTVRIPGT
jgi:hypothetical protein